MRSGCRRAGHYADAAATIHDLRWRIALAGCSLAAPAEPMMAPEAAAPAEPAIAEATAAPAAHDAPHWTYEGEEGPDRWADLSAEFATCGSGSARSPI